MNVLDLFSGIGGFSLGLERAGMRTVAFCEIEPYCRAVLAKHWPGVPVYDDVRTVTGERLRADGISVDVVCGGFPCQDLSVTGKRAGITAERSGLWSELARIIGEVGPRFAIVENVSNLLAGPSEQPGGWYGRVLGDLAALGYDAEWHCIPAAAVGAPHRRDRVWIVAYPSRHEQRRSEQRAERQRARLGGQSKHLADAEGDDEPREPAVADARRPLVGAGARASSRIARRHPAAGIDVDRRVEVAGGARSLADANGPRLEIRLEGDAGERSAAIGRGRWEPEPDVGRVAHGVPARVDRLRALGNAVVPQVVEIIGRAIMKQLTNDHEKGERV